MVSNLFLFVCCFVFFFGGSVDAGLNVTFTFESEINGFVIASAASGAPLCLVVVLIKHC